MRKFGLNALRRMRRGEILESAFNAMTCAYLAGVMMHGTPYAGAVGCIMNHRKLIELQKQFGAEKLSSAMVRKKSTKATRLITSSVNMEWYEALSSYRQGNRINRRFAGYTAKELDMIDGAFNSVNIQEDADCFLGMTQALNLLCVIHKLEEGPYYRYR